MSGTYFAFANTYSGKGKVSNVNSSFFILCHDQLKCGYKLLDYVNSVHLKLKILPNTFFFFGGIVNLIGILGWITGGSFLNM